MGAPAFTEFCQNGHILKSVAEHYADTSEVEKCPWCDAELVHTEYYWGDSDYQIPDYNSIPSKPVRYEWHKVNNENIRGEVRVPVYDVSKVIKWRKMRFTIKQADEVISK